MSFKKAILIILFFIAGGLRLWNIANNPPSLTWDEVSIGYNAYSILKTGKDEHGRFLPLDTFIAYGDYKPPLSIYLTVPFIAVLGLNELSVRLPSALFGIATVILVYFLVKEMFQKGNSGKIIDKQNSKQLHFSANLSFFEKYLPLTTVLVLTFSPWHINLSRAGFEANIALFFVVFGIYLFMRAKSYPNVFIVVWLPFVAAIYTFNSARYTVPFLSIGLCVYYFRKIKKNWKKFLLGVCIAILCLIPITGHLLSKESRLRFAEVNIFSDISIVQKANTRIAQSDGNVISKIFSNRRMGYAYTFIIHYFDHFEPSFLFIRGDGNPKFSTQDVGQLYPIEAIFLSLGVISFLAYYPKLGLFLLYWLSVAIIPAATARETPHALRIINSLPTWHIFIAFGLIYILWMVRNSLLSKYNKRKIVGITLIMIISTVYVFQILHYLYNYHIHYGIKYAGEWQYGYKQAIQSVLKNTSGNENIVITNSIGRAYMYTLFYTKYDPQQYLSQKKSYFDPTGFYHVDGFGRYRFENTNFGNFVGTKNTVVVSSAPQISNNSKLIDSITLPDGNPILWVYRN